MTQSSSLPSPHASSGADLSSGYLPGMPYRHYKGGAYAIVGLGVIESDLSQVVVYESMRDRSRLWVRPLDVFAENVPTPQGTQPRFAPDWPASLGCLDFLPRAHGVAGAGLLRRALPALP
ncbi:DUF1653 domain-containing protein [Cupriavidus basilensis]